MSQQVLVKKDELEMGSCSQKSKCKYYDIDGVICNETNEFNNCIQYKRLKYFLED